MTDKTNTAMLKGFLNDFAMLFRTVGGVGYSICLYNPKAEFTEWTAFASTLCVIVGSCFGLWRDSL